MTASKGLPLEESGTSGAGLRLMFSVDGVRGILLSENVENRDLDGEVAY